MQLGDSSTEAAEAPTAEEIRTDLLLLAMRHLDEADRAEARGHAAAFGHHLHNFYAIAEARL